MVLGTSSLPYNINHADVYMTDEAQQTLEKVDGKL